MPRIEKYQQGTPSWVDLSTSDQEAAKSFYTTVLGWEYEDNEVGGGQYYSMATIDGAPAGAIATQQPEEAQQGISVALERLHHSRRYRRRRRTCA